MWVYMSMITFCQETDTFSTLTSAAGYKSNIRESLKQGTDAKDFERRQCSQQTMDNW